MKTEIIFNVLFVFLILIQSSSLNKLKTQRFPPYRYEEIAETVTVGLQQNGSFLSHQCIEKANSQFGNFSCEKWILEVNYRGQICIKSPKTYQYLKINPTTCKSYSSSGCGSISFVTGCSDAERFYLTSGNGGVSLGLFFNYKIKLRMAGIKSYTKGGGGVVNAQYVDGIIPSGNEVFTIDGVLNDCQIYVGLKCFRTFKGDASTFVNGAEFLFQATRCYDGLSKSYFNRSSWFVNSDSYVNFVQKDPCPLSAMLNYITGGLNYPSYFSVMTLSDVEINKGHNANFYSLINYSEGNIGTLKWGCSYSSKVNLFPSSFISINDHSYLLSMADKRRLYFNCYNYEIEVEQASEILDNWVFPFSVFYRAK